jgi:hypothetical protein
MDTTNITESGSSITEGTEALGKEENTEVETILGDKEKGEQELTKSTNQRIEKDDTKSEREDEKERNDKNIDTIDIEEKEDNGVHTVQLKLSRTTAQYCPNDNETFYRELNLILRNFENNILYEHLYARGKIINDTSCAFMILGYAVSNDKSCGLFINGQGTYVSNTFYFSSNIFEFIIE